MSTPESLSLRRLLLHRLPEIEAQQLEERLMLEEDLAGSLREAEHDLLDDYVGGRLGADERADVEKYLLATERDRQRLKIAAGLTRMLKTSETPGVALLASSLPLASSSRRSYRWKLGLTAAACLSLAVIAIAPRMMTRGPSQEVTTTVVLLADSPRGSEVRAVDIPAVSRQLKIQIEIPSNAARTRYRVSITDSSGRRSYEVGGLDLRTVAGYSFVEALVPATAFASPSPRFRLTVAADTSARSAETATWLLQVRRH